MATKLKQFTVVNGELFHRKTGFKARYKMENIKITERFVYQLNTKTGKYKKIGTVGKFKTKRAEKHVNKYFRERQNKIQREWEKSWNVVRNLKDEDYTWTEEDEQRLQEWRKEREREEREQQNEEIDEEIVEDDSYDVNKLSNVQIERRTKEFYQKDANIDIDKYQIMNQNFNLIAEELLKRNLITVEEYQDLINKFEATLEQDWSVQREKVFSMLWKKLKKYYPEEGFKYMELQDWFS